MQFPSQRRVVVGVDGSLPSVFAIRWAAQQARLRDADLCAVIVDEDPALVPAPYAPAPTPAERRQRWAALGRTLVESVSTALGPCPDLAVQEHVDEGHPAEVLGRYSEGAALLVLGSHRRGGERGSELGPTIRGCIRSASCPVAVITEGTELVDETALVPGAALP
jgi:nucleotide-binding universal stress UspA family protein